MKNNSPKKNFIYNLSYQILALIIPLITSPYLSRKVGADGVGIYSYTYSIVYYFMLFTLLGVSNYGNRMIAQVRDDKEKVSKTFWSIYLFQFFMGIFMLALYLGYIIIFDNQYQTIAFIQSFFIISAILDINWFFFGLEEFKKTIVRNSIVKIANLILIFLFVKYPTDLWKYTLIMSCMTCLGQIVLWPFVLKKIKFVRVELSDILKHIKSNFILFIPVIAVSLYKIMDKIMLGFLTSVDEVGYYEYAEKIVNIPLTIITALGTIMLPRISNIVAKGCLKQVNNYITKSINFVMFVSFAMCFGLIAIGYNFAPFYFGDDFQKSGILIMLLACTMPLLSFANVIRTQYLIPMEKDKIYINSVIFGALSNLIINYLLIPKYKSVGACIGTIIAELVVTITQVYSIKKEINVSIYIKNIIPFFLKSIVMFIFVYAINYININEGIRLILQLLIGILLYSILNYKYILSVVNLKSLKVGKLK